MEPLVVVDIAELEVLIPVLSGALAGELLEVMKASAPVLEGTTLALLDSNSTVVLDTGLLEMLREALLEPLVATTLSDTRELLLETTALVVEVSEAEALGSDELLDSADVAGEPV